MYTFTIERCGMVEDDLLISDGYVEYNNVSCRDLLYMQQYEIIALISSLCTAADKVFDCCECFESNPQDTRISLVNGDDVAWSVNEIFTRHNTFEYEIKLYHNYGGINPVAFCFEYNCDSGKLVSI